MIKFFYLNMNLHRTDFTLIKNTVQVANKSRVAIDHLHFLMMGNAHVIINTVKKMVFIFNFLLYYDDGSNLECQLCPDSCLTCNVDGCLSCDSDLFRIYNE